MGGRYDYARFCMRAGQLGRAEQALRQVLALLPGHHAALMALTALHLTLGELENAEVYARVRADSFRIWEGRS